MVSEWKPAVDEKACSDKVAALLHQPLLSALTGTCPHLYKAA